MGLFPHGGDVLHRPEELLYIYAAHVGGLLTQTEEIGLLGGNSLPLGQHFVNYYLVKN